jgi:O-antigen ligase
MLRHVERWFVLLMLLYLSSGILGFIWPDSDAGLQRPENNAALFAFQTGFCLLAFCFILLRWNKFVNGLAAARWVLALGLVAVASTLWSQDPAITQRRSLVLLGTTAFGIYLGTSFSMEEQLKLLRQGFAWIIGLSIWFALLLPEWGIDHDYHSGDWQGIFGQKNLLGKAMVVAILVFLSSKGLSQRWLRWPGIGLGLLLIAMSGSRTAGLVLAGLLLLVPTYRLFRVKLSASVPLAIGLVAAAGGVSTIMLANAGMMFSLLGRDSTLTGRTGVWQAVWEAISKHMLLGYGFSGFWAGLRGESANVILTLGWAARHAHNGFLDLWLELGLLGLGLFAISYFAAFRHAVRMFVNRQAGAAWPMNYLAFMLLYHLTEGPILKQNSLYWALYVAIAVSVASLPREQTENALASNEEANGIYLEPEFAYLP